VKANFLDTEMTKMMLTLEEMTPQTIRTLLTMIAMMSKAKNERR
jgi:hypothetical protein